MQSLPLLFTALVIPGSHRGAGMGTPTLNLNLSNVPAELKEGIYACHLFFDDQRLNAAMHYGPRPVHKDAPSCEVHALDVTIDTAPAAVSVAVISFLRPVADFPSEEALKTQIADDIRQARGILKAYGSRTSETTDS